MSKHFLKVIVLGDSGVGKTSLINRYVREEFSQSYRATIGCDFLQKEVMIDQDYITLQIWDTAGQERFRSVGNAFYRGTDCLILVYDITDRNTFDNVTAWKNEFFQTQNINEEFPIILISNKIDLDHMRKVDKLVGQRWAEANDALFFECSAKVNFQVEEAFIEVSKRALRNSQMDDRKMGFGVVLNQQKTGQQLNATPTKRKCCQ